MVRTISFVLALFAVAVLGTKAQAACPGTALTNGTTANANDVMAWLDCKAPLVNPEFTGSASIGVAPIAGTPLSVRGTSLSSGDLRANVVLDDNSALAAGNGSGILFRGVYSGTSITGWSGISGVKENGTSGDYAGALTFMTAPNAGGYAERMRITSAGYVGIGTLTPGQKLDVAGTIRQSNCTTAGTLSANASGDIICTSDARLKSILGPYKEGLDAILQISPQRFSYKPTRSNPVETFVHAGFIAQNVKAAIPEASAMQRDGYYSLDTTAILAASVNAIKELHAVNLSLERTVRAQAVELERLRADVSALQRGRLATFN